MLKAPFTQPCQPKLAQEIPAGPDWLHEVKFDGWRLQIHNGPNGVSLYSCNGNDLTSRFSALAAQIKRVLDGSVCVIDGELVASDAKGLPNFRELHGTSGRGADLTVWAFDLMMHNGEDIRELPLVDRKDRLCALVGGTGPAIQFSDGFDDGQALMAECDRLGLEGIISKKRESAYRSGPSGSWITVKCAAWREANQRRRELFQR